jgi:ribosomal protein S18 acetylase RimI-like enzyme
LIEYRPFRNNDAPQLAEVWRSQAAQRGLMQPMSAAIFEELVLANPIFDREGLILAVEAKRVLGFVHAGFGATADEAHLSTELGAISMLLVRAPDADPAIATELLGRAEQYLRSHGAKAAIAAGSRRADPFYLGLYGGSRLTGVLESDLFGQALFRGHGYREIARFLVLHRDLATFRPTFDRKQMQIRRGTSVALDADPSTKTWWEACTLGRFERKKFTLNTRGGKEQMAEATFWDIEPLSTTWGFHAAGLVNLKVASAQRRQGLATFLLGEAFAQLHAQSMAVVEAQVEAEDKPTRDLLGKLGFVEVDQSVVLRKDFA